MIKQFTHLYFAHIPFLCDGYLCDARKKEIDACSNSKVKQEKFYVWKLLEFALKKSLNINIRDVEFTKQENGKWVCKECWFSFSHSHDIVCVAISDERLGVDLEYMDSRRHPLTLLDKTLCGDEKCQTEADFFTMWTIKEAAFKFSEGVGFNPQTIDTTKIENKKTDFINIGADRYVWTVVGDYIENIKIFFR